tara:strand:- start:8903 stop:9115 length:213 start_codon:yes stop_codon:yes gene_type:complete
VGSGYVISPAAASRVFTTAFKGALIVPQLPNTRSGKILRKTLPAMVDGEEYTVVSTIEDPSVLEEITGRL